MPKEIWKLLRRGGPYQQIGEAYHIDPVVARIMRNRDIIGEEQIRCFLRGGTERLHDPALLKGGMEAARLIREKIHSDSRIRVIGDYDIDGVCSACIWQKALESLGARADCAIPDRLKDGYGINERLIRLARDEGVDTIVTCDNGISANSQIDYARSLGMTVILTDHHRIAGELPPANVVVNPHQEQETYPFPDICGAVVAWKVVQLLLRLEGREEEYLEYLPLAAFATVGDVCDLRDENRIIVKLGLRALPRMENPGMQALIRQTGVGEKAGRISAYHVGFILGPCINAAGRLDTAKRSLRLLLTRDRDEADRLAAQLVELNQKRQALTQLGEVQAMAQAKRYDRDRVLVLYLPECGESIAGIVAGRVRERENKPVIIVTNSREEGVLKGSGRSIEAYDMHRALTGCAHLLEQFGGHPMAAGLTIRQEKLEQLRLRLNETCTLTAQDLIPRILIDADMPIDYLSEKVITDLQVLEPWGKGNEKPCFAQRDLTVRGVRVMGQRRQAVKLAVESPGGRRLDALYFGDADLFLADLQEKWGEGVLRALLSGRGPGGKLDVIYYPSINEFQGQRQIQIIVSHYR